MLENVYEGLNARSNVYLSKVYFCEMFPNCVSSKLYSLPTRNVNHNTEALNFHNSQLSTMISIIKTSKKTASEMHVALLIS